ncbi:hypothetical protein [Parabacteroides pacaensis]|uniref:hypothetical protein n=1 Tax=Parabacteroides pacaensis TaxID=2086575 RepID=UPI000D0FA323|nr:hypothetical protein [Parabacteroides pacaensis]
MDKRIWDIIRIALKEAIPLPAIKAFFKVLEYEENTAFQDEVKRHLESISEDVELLQVCLENTDEIKKQLQQFSYIPIEHELKRKLDQTAENFPPLQTPHILYILSQYNAVDEFYSMWGKSLNSDICNDLEFYIIERRNDYSRPVNLLEHPVTKMAQYHAAISGYAVLNEMDLLLGAYMTGSKTIQKLESKYFSEDTHSQIIEKLKNCCEKSHAIIATDDMIFNIYKPWIK